MSADQRFNVLLRYDDANEPREFIELFGQDFNILHSTSDSRAMELLGEYGRNIVAAFFCLHDVRQAFDSAFLQGLRQRYPSCLRVWLSNNMVLDDVIELVGRQAVDKCFSHPYDKDLIRSLVYTAGMDLHDSTVSSTLSGSDESLPIVLIVDDEQSATKYLRKQLERMQDQFSILCAADAEAALEVVRDHPVAVIMTDQRMPGMKGDQLLNELRRSRPHIVRVLTSAYGEVNVALDAVNEGKIFRYQKKPWDAKEVLLCLEAALEEHQAQVQIHRQNRNSIEQEFERICCLRRAVFSEMLGSIIEDVVGEGNEGVLQRFLDDMESVSVLPPNIAHVRASHDTNIERQLWTEMQEEISRRLGRLEKADTDTWRLAAGLLSEALPIFIESGSTDSVRSESEVANDLIEEVMSALETLLSSSGLSQKALEYCQTVEGSWILSCGDRPLKMFAHLMAPLTRISRPLILQQSALLVLYAICYRLGGKITLQGGHQCFSLTLTCPLQYGGESVNGQ
ncbi:response regulator [Hahella ganghwensis]|uniref:response regulator n=1 Tax=Hahella ganghwensis TaxID=286420 RepID=UPI00036CECBE|nr:response regulator [Hahella ganghwensis]